MGLGAVHTPRPATHAPSESSGASRLLLALAAIWGGELVVLAVLTVLQSGLGLQVWPIGEDRSWLYFIQNRESTPIPRAFWAVDGRNPLAPWWYIVVLPIINSSPYGLYVVRKGVDLLCAASVLLLLDQLLAGRARWFAFTTALLVMFWNFNGYLSHVLWTMLVALALSALTLWSYLVDHDAGGRRSGYLALSWLAYLAAIGTYTIQASTVLAVWGLAFWRPYGDGKGRSLPERFYLATRRTLPYFGVLSIFVLIWLTVGHPEMFVDRPKSLFLAALSSLRYWAWHDTFTQFAREILALAGTSAMVWILSLAALGTAGFLFLASHYREAACAGLRGTDFVSIGICLAGFSAGTIALETTSAIWFAGTRTLMLQQVVQPLLYMTLVFAAARVLPHQARWIQTAGSAALVFFTLALATHYNWKLVAQTRSDQRFEQALKRFAPQATTPLLFIVRQDASPMPISRPLSEIYAKTFYRSPNASLRFLHPGGPIEKYEDWRDVYFGPGGVYLSASPGDPAWALSPTPRWVPYHFVRMVDFDGATVHPIPVITAGELKGFRAVVAAPGGRVDFGAAHPDAPAVLREGQVSLLFHPELNSPVSAKSGFGVVTSYRGDVPALLGVAGGVPLRDREFIFAHANSVIEYSLEPGRWKTLSFSMGLDDVSGRDGGSVVYVVKGDGKELYRSQVIRSMATPVAAKVRIAGVKKLELIVTDAGDDISSDEAYWIQPALDAE